MPIIGFGEDVQRGQALGKGLAGPNAFGIFAKGMLDRANAVGLLKAKSQFDVSGEVAKEQALGPFRVGQARAEAQAKAEGEAAGQPPIPPGFVQTQVRQGPNVFQSPGALAQVAGATAQNREIADRLGAAHQGRQVIQQIREMLEMAPSSKDPQQMVIGQRGLVPPRQQRELAGFTLSGGQRNFSTLLGKLYNAIAFARTGRQGLERSIPIVSENYSIGTTDPDETIAFRLQEAEAELADWVRKFEAGEVGSSDYDVVE